VQKLIHIWLTQRPASWCFLSVLPRAAYAICRHPQQDSPKTGIECPRPSSMTFEPKAYPDLMSCEQCDEVYARQEIRKGEKLICARCSSRLESEPRFTVSTWMALTVTAACLFVFANAFPVAVISLDGLQNQATVWQAILALGQGPGAPVALAAGLVTIGIPAVQITLLLWVLSFALAGRSCPYFVSAMRLLHFCRPWGMTEVFLLGILVAIIKLSAYLHVVIGVGVFSIALLAPLMAVITLRSTHELWLRYEDEP